jgi:hypothetical protein
MYIKKPATVAGYFMRAEITPYYESLWSLPLALRATFYLYPLICLSAILVSLSAAFFRVWRLTRRIMLFVPQSSVCLASSSQSLNRYVFFPNNYLHLASFSRPNSLACQVLSTFHIIPGQSFAFISKQGLNLCRFLRRELLYR